MQQQSLWSTLRHLRQPPPYHWHPAQHILGAGQTSSEVLLFLEDSSWLSVMAFPEVKASQKHRVRATFEKMPLPRWSDYGSFSAEGIGAWIMDQASAKDCSWHPPPPHLLGHPWSMVTHGKTNLQFSFAYNPVKSRPSPLSSSFCISVPIWDLLIRQH